MKAVAGIAGAYNSPAWFARQMGHGPYRAALASFLDRYDEYLPVVAPSGGEAAMGVTSRTPTTARPDPPRHTGRAG
ncbi:hypothetical protein ACFQX6_37025 [Streptosporangium lutulentum]